LRSPGPVQQDISETLLQGYQTLDDKTIKYCQSLVQGQYIAKYKREHPNSTEATRAFNANQSWSHGVDHRTEKIPMYIAMAIEKGFLSSTGLVLSSHF
jgi:hypothetical protein